MVGTPDLYNQWVRSTRGLNLQLGLVRSGEAGSSLVGLSPYQWDLQPLHVDSVRMEFSL